MYARLLMLVVAVTASPMAAQDGNPVPVVEECSPECRAARDVQRQSAMPGADARNATAWAAPLGSVIVPLKATSGLPQVAVQLPGEPDALRPPIHGAGLTTKRIADDLRLRQAMAKPEDRLSTAQSAIDDLLDARAIRRLPFASWCGGTPLRGRNW